MHQNMDRLKCEVFSFLLFFIKSDEKRSSENAVCRFWCISTNINFFDV